MTTRAAAAFVSTLLAAAVLVVAFGPPGNRTSVVAHAHDLRLAAAVLYADGAPPGFSGGFNEQSCQACHFHAEVNSGPGRVSIAGVPERFVPGERYPITITLTRTAMTLGGFQLTARFTDGGAQAGALAPAPEDEHRIGIAVQGNIQYAGQRQKGAALAAPDTARWALVWIAPMAGAPVTLHVAANAADGDERADGDYIHTSVVHTSPAGHR